MFFFKQKISELETKVTESKNVKLGQDIITLGSLCIDDQQEGNFFIEDTLTVNANALIIGNITTTHCIIEGKVIGNIICTEYLQLGATAIIDGTIMTKTAVMEEGCIINGRVLLDPNIKVSLLSLKIAEAKNSLEKEGEDILFELTKNLEEVKKDSNILQNTHSKNEEILIVRKQSSVYAEPTSQSDNWW